MKQRLVYFDNLKGFAILLVVLGHCIQTHDISNSYQFLFRFIYSFHMPLFMMVSGYFGYKASGVFLKDFKKKVSRLLVPYLVWGGGKLLFHKCSPFLLVVDPDRFLWFLWDLFFISIFVNCIMAIVKDSNRAFLTVCLMAVVMILLGKFLPNNDYNIKSICWMFHFYVAGILYNRFLSNSSFNKWLGPLFVILLIIMVWLRYKYIPQESLLSNGIMLIIAYIGCFAFFLSFKAYADSHPFLSILGQATLGIYAVHYDCMRILGYVVNNIWFLFVVSVLLSYLFVYVIRKTKYMGFLIGE